MFSFHPKDVVRQRLSGRANMDEDTASFGLNEGWCLVAARVKFTGGTGTAACTITVNNEDDPEGAYDALLYDFDGELLGTGTDAHVSVETEGWELLHAYSFTDRQRLQFNWTNPDALDIQWGIELLMIPWSKISEYRRA